MIPQSILDKYAHIPRARNSDPVTSHEAAARAESFVAGHEAKILGALHEAGFIGMTAKEIADKTGLIDVQVNRRLSAMGERKVIRRNGARRGGCMVWCKT